MFLKYVINTNIYLVYLCTSIVLMPIENLTVYMKSLENGVVGLRWSYLENSNLLGFVVSFNKDKITPKSQNVSIIFPTKCPIWSNYFCHTFVNLTAIGNFTFNVSIDK